MTMEVLEQTRLKFVLSPKNGELIAFVTRHKRTKQLRGVDENSLFGKQICVLSEELKGTLVPYTPYDVELKPMFHRKGYIVVKAERTTFEAEFETVIVPKAIYQVRVTFGHKTIYFDPLEGNSPSSNTAKGVEKILNGRDDLKDKEAVIERFRVEAAALLVRMEADGIILK